MRELKFRTWHHGYKNTCSPAMLVDDYPGQCFKWLQEGQPIEIMKFTGLYDKNGVEIYEGDIVKLQVNQHIWFYQIGCIENGGTNLYAINICDNATIDDETDTYTYQVTNVRAGFSRSIPSGCEIVGNIYQNKELLEVINA